MTEQYNNSNPNNNQENNLNNFVTQVTQLIREGMEQANMIPEQISADARKIATQLEEKLLPNLLQYEPFSRPFQIQAKKLGIETYLTKAGVRIQIPEELWTKYGQEEMDDIETNNFQEIAWASIEQHPNGFAYLIHMIFVSNQPPIILPDWRQSAGPVVVQMLKQVLLTAAYQTKFYRLLYLWGQYDLDQSRPHYKPNQIPITSFHSTEEEPKYHNCGQHYSLTTLKINNPTMCPLPNYKCPYIKECMKESYMKGDPEDEILPSLIQKMTLGSPMKTFNRTKIQIPKRSRYNKPYKRRPLHHWAQEGRQSTFIPPKKTFEEELKSDYDTYNSEEEGWNKMLIDLDEEI
jgi:hypothetical protein